VARIAESVLPGRDVRLTERDYKLLAFAAQHRLVLERQVEQLVELDRGKLRGRLRALAGEGYLRAGRVFDERYYQIRPAGLAAINSELPAPRFKLTAYKHDVGVAWLWLAAHRGTFGALRELLPERVLRSHDGAIDRAREPYGVRLGGFDRYGNERLHYPDLLLIDPDGRRLALELELTSKGRERRELILGGYGADGRIDRVLYLVEDTREGRATRRLLDGTTREMGLSERVRFQFVNPLRVLPGQLPQGVRREVKRRAAELTL
jgi:hypothetical protein